MIEAGKAKSKPQKILLTLPMDIDRRYRQEAKKREINLSEMLPRLLEERDYLEQKIIEKEKIIENSTEFISNNIVESLSEIRSTNLQLQIISSSLTSIPIVIDDARKINERCIESVNIIKNFNVVTDKVNKKINETVESIQKYNDLIQSNKSGLESINIDIVGIRSDLNLFVKDVKKNYEGQKIRMIEGFSEEIRKSTSEILLNVRKEVDYFKSSSKKKWKYILFSGAALILLFSFFCIYSYVRNTEKIYTDLNFYKNKTSEFYNIICLYKPKVPNLDYKNFCPVK